MVFRRELFELVYVAHLHIKPFCKLVTKSHKKAVLIKEIVGDLLACIDMNLVIKGKKQCFGIDESRFKGTISFNK